MTHFAFRIETLNSSYNAFGMVMDLLSQQPPFSKFQLGQISTAIRAQLAAGYQVAAIGPTQELLGYAGWVRTLRASAELWMEERGPLKVLDKKPYDAVALTIVVSRNREATLAMMREARRLNPGMRVFFKRSYDGQLQMPKKQAVDIVGNG